MSEMEQAPKTSSYDCAQEDFVVFLVEDDDKIRSTLARALTKRGFVVRGYEDAKHFLDDFDGSQPSCLVLDYGLPELNGLELQALLADQHRAIPIIFITGHGGVRESVQAMKAGAIDFLEKPFRQSTLIECIERAMAADKLAREEDGTRRLMQKKFEHLTVRESEIAQFMIANPSNTASKEIGRELNISPRTVDHHRARILEKLGIHSVAELIDLSRSVDKLTSR